jgi:beta-xylosidase
MKALSWLFLFSITCRADAAVTTFTNPVLAGDYPDPSVIRVGTDYWATATSSEWGPQFPLLRSSDLVNWEITGSVFATRPAWAAGNFWAPEISEWRGRYYIYYVARRKGGPLSVACASADKPGGPYTDHGPFISQSAGSIDPVPVTDEKGERWLVWKEDGNSRRLPTILWTQRLDDDGTHVVGQPREILRNDQPWEGAVVEGPFLLRRGD